MIGVNRAALLNIWYNRGKDTLCGSFPPSFYVGEIGFTLLVVIDHFTSPLVFFVFV